MGVTGGRDTSGVWSLGPQLTLTLPLFSRNRPGIAAASATRDVLRAQYQAALDNATGAAEALPNKISLLQSQYNTTRRQAAKAWGIARAAARAYAAGQLDGPSYAVLSAQAGDRQRDAIALQSQLQTAQLSLATLLGLGLPPAASQEDSTP